MPRLWRACASQVQRTCGAGAAHVRHTSGALGGLLRRICGPYDGHMFDMRTAYCCNTHPICASHGANTPR